MDWKESFTPSVLKQGEEYFLSGRVVDLKEDGTGYQALVQEAHAYQVNILVRDNIIRGMRCGCPVAKGRARCKHMAAVMYAAEEKRRKDREEAKARAEEQEHAEKAEEEDSYRYFNIDLLRADIQLTAGNEKKGRAILKKGGMEFLPFVTTYSMDSQELLGQVVGKTSQNGYIYQTCITFGADHIVEKTCDCPGCFNYFHAIYDPKKNCEHVSALFLYLVDYIKKHNIGDATDRSAYNMISSYQAKRASGLVAKENVQPGSLVLKPRLQNKYGKLSASFRVGAQGGKMFVVRDLMEFDGHVKRGENGKYGSSTVLNHNIENFTEEGRAYAEFIRTVIAEESEFAGHLMEDDGYYYGPRVEIKQNFALFGRRLDDFFDLLGKNEIEYEDKTDWKVFKDTLSCREKSPKIVLNISKSVDRRTDIFQGINVCCAVPKMFRGQKYMYYIEERHFCRIPQDFTECVSPLLDQEKEGEVALCIGRNQMQAFYYTVLPKLQDYVEVVEEDKDEIREYLRPEVQFVFYLDAEGQNITCKAHAIYGDREVSVMDLLPERKRVVEGYRDRFRENEALYTVERYFSYANLETDEFDCNEEEDAVYQILCKGVEDLLIFGEVRSTDRFRRLNMVSKPKVSIGVSLRSGLLDLEIASEDIPQEELLDILSSYRKKKKYHRLKSGDFLDLGDDTVEMLAELMESLDVTPKQFVEGKMQIPAYRALYLEKMMEAHEDVYAGRDSHFKNLVKNFKVIEDSDFEEPKSLEKVLRKYQKTGYKWLRTLESCHFGGILADEMGLGKTVQVIAVLLAAKEEGRLGTALVICPASIVFNWGEEIARFAPQLSVCLVAGTQGERRQKLGEYRDYDVLVTSYDLLKRDIVLYDDMQFSFEIIDEAQYIKNHSTGAAKAVKLVHSVTKFALTGTPIENRLSELWSIFDYLMPGFLYRYDTFKKEFETQIVKYENAAASDRLRRMVAPFILRRLKGEVLKDLPEKIEEVRYSRFEEEQQRLYDAQVVHMRQTVAGQDPGEFQRNKLMLLRELVRLRQICCDPSLCFEDYRGGSAKLDSCLELVESAIEGGHKLLLFSQFTSMLAHIGEKLKERGIRFYEITGSTKKETRLSLVKQFNREEDDTPVFLISLKAGGTGLNLIGADIVIHYDPWWNVAVQNQATDRAHRIGQTKRVTVYKLIMKHSIEEKIQKLQESKQDLADQIISGDVNQLSQMTQEELLELLEA